MLIIYQALICLHWHIVQKWEIFSSSDVCLTMKTIPIVLGTTEGKNEILWQKDREKGVIFLLLKSAPAPTS